MALEEAWRELQELDGENTARDVATVAEVLGNYESLTQQCAVLLAGMACLHERVTRELDASDRIAWARETHAVHTLLRAAFDAVCAELDP